MDNQGLKIIDHWISGEEKEVSRMACDKNTKPFGNGMPDSIIIHYTAGKSGKSSAEYLCRKNVQASAHIVLDRSGHIYQLVPFDTIAWHAGKSSYKGRSGFNNFSIGIEIDNAGVLEKVGDKYKAWFGSLYSESEVVQATHRNEASPRYWHTYTEEQISKIFELCEALMDRYPTITSILGHEEISKGRKQDPGPAFPLDRLRQRFFDSREDTSANNDKSEGYVEVSSLNIREMPSIHAGLAASPLPEGTKVRILQEHSGWYKVEAVTEGWVSAQYVALKS
ncbi:N-acetylmuramoyl-L-alanine amidase [Fulvivirga ulvae]|uniref:N-acetylmuramoyl-L-alanine amidase n=1 Tax=Fulvivirga ulvae TaxID=2904245 RepID=UPI001F2755BC|nr:N-acetylmuramoyl-L-alanine amidase [Fulvivirga ulvae]UII31351.1 N-acetylmuramoyl-L-alanine amidase [Fulvivirga ulvae]